MNTTNNSKRGRPSINVQWPNNVFTVKDVISQMNGDISNVTVQLKIKKDLESGVLTRVGRSEMTSGRPSNTYRKISNQPATQPATQSQPDVQEAGAEVKTESFNF